MSVFVDNHYNRYSQLVTDDQGSRAKLSLVSWLAVDLLTLKRGSCVAVSWLAAEFAGPEKGRLRRS
jgi:hypothetical protein